MSDEPKRGFVLAVTLVLGLFFLLTPFVIRSLQGNHALLGEESYAHLAVAQNIVSPDSYPLPDVRPALFDWILAGLFGVATPLLVSKLFPVLLGGIVVMLFSLTSGSLARDVEERSLAGVLLVISPLFLVLFTSLSPLTLLLALAMGSWWWYDRHRGVSLVLLGLLVFVDAKGFVIASALLLAYGLLRGEWKGVAITGGAGLVAIVLLDSVFGFLAQDVIVRDASSVFVSLGASFGYSFFILFLAVVGGLASWSRKGPHVAASIIVIGVLLLSFSDVTARVLLLPIAAVLAAKGGLLLLRRQWSVQSIRNITLFLAGLSLLFTLVLTVSSLSEAEPSLSTAGAMRFLRTVPEGEVVLSSDDLGVFIERMGRREAFLDNVRKDEVVMRTRSEAAERMFFSQRMEVTAQLFEEYGVTHVLIDEDMRDGGVWTADEQGLLFLVENSPSFVEVYDRDGVSVYRYIGGGER